MFFKHLGVCADREDLWNDRVQRCVAPPGMLRYLLSYATVKAFLFPLSLVVCTLIQGSKISCKGVKNPTTLTPRLWKLLSGWKETTKVMKSKNLHTDLEQYTACPVMCPRKMIRQWCLERNWGTSNRMVCRVYGTAVSALESSKAKWLLDGYHSLWASAFSLTRTQSKLTLQSHCQSKWKISSMQIVGHI